MTSIGSPASSTQAASGFAAVETRMPCRSSNNRAALAMSGSSSMTKICDSVDMAVIVSGNGQLVQSGVRFSDGAKDYAALAVT